MVLSCGTTKLNQGDACDSDSMISDDCDEKRSYTPEPRARLETLFKKDGKSLSHSMLGGPASRQNNMSQISIRP